MISDFLQKKRGPGNILILAAVPLIMALAVFRIRAGLSLFQTKEFLTSAEPFFLWSNLLLLSFGIWFSREFFISRYHAISIQTRHKVMAIFLLALLLRSFLPPHTHGMYYDEDIYLNIAQNMINEGRAEVTSFGKFRWDDYYCLEGYLNKQPSGYPAIVSLFFLLFGMEEKVAMILSIFVASLTTVILFLFTNEILDERTALWTALFHSLIPVAIKWGPACSPEPHMVFFMVLTLFLFSLYARSQDFRVAFAAFLSMSFTIQLRPEGVLFIPLCFLFLLIFHNKLVDHLKDVRLSLIFLPFCFILSIHILHIFAFIHENWGATYGDAFSTKYLAGNLKENLTFFIRNREFPVVFTIFSLLGLSAIIKKWRELSFVMLWFLFSFLPYLFFYAGSYEYAASIRFSLLVFSPLCILSGIGMGNLQDFLENILPDRKPAHYLCALLLIVFLPHVTSIRTASSKTWEVRFDHDFIVREARKLPLDAIIFSHSPYVIILNARRGALQCYYGSRQDKLDYVFQHTRHVYFYRDYWCYSLTWMENYKYFCENFEMTPVASEKLNNREYTLFRIRRKL